MIECYFCGAQVATVPDAIAAGWWPYFVRDGREVAEPFCPACAANVLTLSADGEYEDCRSKGKVQS
jgi:hypothetical protein